MAWPRTASLRMGRLLAWDEAIETMVRVVLDDDSFGELLAVAWFVIHAPRLV